MDLLVKPVYYFTRLENVKQNLRTRNSSKKRKLKNGPRSSLSAELASAHKRCIDRPTAEGCDPSVVVGELKAGRGVHVLTHMLTLDILKTPQRLHLETKQSQLSVVEK